jgi:hypothetical protein
MSVLRRLRQAVLPTPTAPRGPARAASSAADDAGPGDVLRPRVVAIVHDPPLPGAGGRRLSEAFGWHDARALASQYVDDIAEASHGLVRYNIVEWVDAGLFPVKRDGFRYTAESYQAAWRERRFHQPDAIDYHAQVADFDLVGRYDRGEMDEAWFFSFPYSGDYESLMVGRDAFWCNAPPLEGTGHCRGRFVVMAFNYERDEGCMLENFGHRTESIMAEVYRRHPPERNLWARFTRYDKSAPGRAECGNVHFAPNSDRDYDWGNPRPVRSGCETWQSFPDLSGPRLMVDCCEWGGGDMRAHHLWWLSHLPHVAGETDAVAHNWWRYVVDPNHVP